jgi:hypothetical protein
MCGILVGHTGSSDMMGTSYLRSQSGPKISAKKSSLEDSVNSPSLPKPPIDNPKSEEQEEQEDKEDQEDSGDIEDNELNAPPAMASFDINLTTSSCFLSLEIRRRIR